MENKNNDYYNYGDEDEFLYDDNEEYDYTHHDELLDCIIDKLQSYGCKHHINHIEDFLTDFGDLTLAEWSRDLMDPSISNFTCNYITQLLNQKDKTLMRTTPPVNNNKLEILAPLHEKEKEKVQADRKCGNFNDNKNKRIFTKELKTAFTKAAFQQWKIATQATRIQESISEKAKCPIPSALQTLTSAASKIIKENTYVQPKSNTKFTKELKIAFTSAAFQQWKRVLQEGKTQDLLASTTAAIQKSHNQLSAEAKTFTPKNTFIGKNEQQIIIATSPTTSIISATTESATTPAATIALSIKSSTTFEATLKTATRKIATRNNNNNNN
jgi:hypothetical protein